MENLEFKQLKGYEEINTPEQLDTFEPQFLFGLHNRYIFDFSSTMYMSNNTLFWIYDTDTNFSLDPGDTGDPSSSGRISDYILLNQAYWRGNPQWTMQGQPNNGKYYFRNHRAIGTSDDTVIFPPILSWQNTPATEFIEDFVFDADLGKPSFDITTGFQGTTSLIFTEGCDPSFIKANYLKQVPIINKDIAFQISNDKVNAFRSGYFEFSVKTDNQNCIIGYAKNALSSEQISTIDENIIVSNLPGDGANEAKISIKNGKLSFSYKDLGGTNPQSFELISNEIIANNQWHHIVINFGKNGILTKNFKKSNKRFIEFWIDGKLDIVNYDYLNKKQIFIPMMQWLFVDPSLTFKRNTDELWKSYDSMLSYDLEDVLNSQYNLEALAVGVKEFGYSIYTGIWNTAADNIAFSGSLYTFISGFNVALSPKEIRLRNSLFISDFPITVSTLNASAEMLSPIVTTNKKKALKLFWNDIENNKDGIELDDNYAIHTVSITHKNKTSITEIYNIDNSNNKNIQYLSDVKAVFTDNINIFGPGKIWNQGLNDIQETAFPFGGILYSSNFRSFKDLNSVRWPKWNPQDGYKQTKEYADYAFSDAALIDMPFSGINLNDGDRILLTNQIRSKENGIYVFNGYNKLLTRAKDADSPSKLNNSVVRVVDGYYKDTSWILSNTISSISDGQLWIQLEIHPDQNNINSIPIFIGRWSNNDGSIRMIDLESDINIQDYDLIVFMNYPESNQEIKKYFIDYDDLEINKIYNDFIKSLKNVVANGANLYVSSPRLAQDLGIVKQFTEVPQLFQSSDSASASLSPFELGELPERYFDTHRNNKYSVVTTLAGLTNKETYLLTDFINFTPETGYDYDQYHAKYSYRQFGLQEGNEFIIPGTALRKVTENENLPGFKTNQIGTKPLMAVAPSDILSGTVITELANNYYDNSVITPNPYDDYATTIIVHNGQLLQGTPINGKIFVNCIEDGYTFSREEYNKATIQILPQNDVNETNATRAWQYSTTRLDRKPQRINVSSLTKNGQTTPTNGGGGAFIQAASNSGNGIIRSKTDKGNVDYQSDLYPTEEEEIYPLQEIPVLSMTWLGLQWLAG